VVPSDGGARYELTAVRYGTRLTTKSDVFLHYDVYGEPDEPVQMDYFCWVARNPERTILVDCGFNSGSGARRGRTMVCPPVTALQRLGIQPADVSLLIVTHAHYDHIGNLDAFPAADIVMSEREYEFWTGPLAKRPLFAVSAETEDIDALRRARQAGRIRFLPRPTPAPSPARQPVTAGVDVLEIGGHTPGQLIVLISTGDGEAVVASDALHYYDEMRLDRPFAHVADLPAMYAGFEVLRDLTADGTRHLVAGHDPEVMRRFPPIASTTSGSADAGLDHIGVRIGPVLPDPLATGER
jgi:glyoxylase-like metal-dependent hydrolase (beta-lactamase superfamily II)